MFKIAEASEKDIPAIVEIARKTWWDAYSEILDPAQIRYMLDAIYDPATLGAQIVNGAQIYLLLTADGQHQAFAAFGKRSEDSGVYKIHKLYVLPHNQRMGYGQALVDEIQARLRQLQVRILDLNVNRHNSARSFYEKLGFRVIREEDVPVGPYWMNDYVMRLEW